MKITIKRQDIVGPIKLPGFNGVGEINLEDFIGMEIEIPRGYEFESLGSLDLDNEVDELDDIWSNDGVREEGNTEERIQALENNFSIKGYLTKYTPGMGSKDSKGKENPVEGRGRALAGKRNSEKKIPWINLRKIIDGNRPRISGGVLENLKHDPATKGTREDVITAGLSLINCKELEPNEVDINDWLKNEILIHNYFTQRNVTLILDGIIKRYAAGENAVRIKERKPWMEILDKEFHISVDNKTTFLFSMDSETYSCRAFCEAVLEYGQKNPVDIILYTKKRLPSEARAKKDNFLKDIDGYTRLTYKAVGNRRDTEFKNVDPSKHYTIKGCIPQFIEDHKDEWNSKELVDIDSY
tara:strand:- start:149 stop:1213 length:1065 start_codon:yes stop_codon:yes gene_type:complete